MSNSRLVLHYYYPIFSQWNINSHLCSHNNHLSNPHCTCPVHLITCSVLWMIKKITNVGPTCFNNTVHEAWWMRTVHGGPAVFATQLIFKKITVNKQWINLIFVFILNTHKCRYHTNTLQHYRDIIIQYVYHEFTACAVSMHLYGFKLRRCVKPVQVLWLCCFYVHLAEFLWIEMLI